MSEQMSELTLIPPGQPGVVKMRVPSGGEGDYLILSWVLDPDGAGCAVVALPDGVCARIDRLQHDGWEVVGLGWIRPEAGGPKIMLPS